MRKIPIFQVDTFSNRVFAGNAAAVCPLEAWLDDSLLLSIAQENNLSETGFFIPYEEEGYHIRWFTPVAEVDLCGHATLAAAFVIFNNVEIFGTQVSFQSRSGTLTVARENDLLTMDFPSQPPEPCEAPKELLEGLGQHPSQVLRSEDYFVVYESEEDILGLKPDFQKLKKVGLRGVTVTSKGREADFVSRFFAPKLGIDEDPVTGSSHCALTPYWAGKLGKDRLRAFQLSKRGGELICEHRGDRTGIAGQAVQYMEGTITV